MTPAVLAEAVWPPGAPRRRLEEVALALFDGFPTRSSARKAARRGELAVDGVPSRGGSWVAPGQRITLLENPHRPPAVFALPLRVITEDAHIAVVEKVPGFPTSGSRHRTIEHALPHNLGPSDAADALRWPRPAHRLDAPTGGLLLCAKTRSALASLSGGFQRHEIHKRYRAIAVGRLEGSGRVEQPIEGRAAATRWKTADHVRSLRAGWLTTVDLWPETGRTHQIRRHLAALGHPVLGDGAYGIEGLVLRGKGLFLWAVELELRHPSTGDPLHALVEEPHKFHALRAREARRWARHHGAPPA